MGKSLKIAMVAACPFPFPRGTPVRIQRLSEALCDRGHEVHIVTYHLGEEDVGAPYETHRTRETSWYTECSPGPTLTKLCLLDPLLLSKLRQVLKSKSIDIVHAHHYEGLLVASLLCRWTGQPFVYDAHTLLESELPSYSLGLPSTVKRWLGRRLDRAVPSSAGHTIAVSDEIRRYLTRHSGVAKDRVTVVTSGVEARLFNGRKAKSVRSRTLGAKQLVFAGNLAPYQGIELMLEAFREVTAQFNNVRLRIVTDTSFAGYESLAQGLGVRDRIDVIHVGFDRVPAYLQAADVLLNPRMVCDGIPQKLLNYMASGKPVVSFAGSAKLITHEENGLVACADNPSAFAAATVRLLGDVTLAGRLGSNARRLVETGYTWDVAAAKTELIYESLLED